MVLEKIKILKNKKGSRIKEYRNVQVFLKK